MTTIEVINAAAKHAGTGGMISSAKLALNDAIFLMNDGKFKAARLRALVSLAYSVGIFHPTYLAVEASNHIASKAVV